MVLSPKIEPIVAWLIDGAPGADQPDAVLQQLCDGLYDSGLPLHRVAVFVRTLHPNAMGRRLLWLAGSSVSISEAPHEVLSQETFLRSPAQWVAHRGEEFRAVLEDGFANDAFPVLAELHAEGVTDYLALPLNFTNGETHVATWSTCRAGGFTDHDLAAIREVVRPLSRVAEIFALRRTASNLLNTYVGRNSGEQILGGRIRRGDVEEIHSVIWLSDLRGFTRLSESRPGHEVIALLNSYFDCLVPAIESAGGEVLKFMGDGVLAIFPIAAASETPAVCQAALKAALEASGRLENWNREHADAETPSLRFGLALHHGRLLYGNIGSGGRLDFTAIGPAVNLAARLESLAAERSREIVLSASFAESCPMPTASIGHFTLRGVGERQEVFVPGQD